MPCPDQQYYHDYVLSSLNKVMYTVYLANLNKKKKKKNVFRGRGKLRLMVNDPVPSQAELDWPRGRGRRRLPGSALIHEIVQDNPSGWSHAGIRFGRQLM